MFEKIFILLIITIAVLFLVNKFIKTMTKQDHCCSGCSGCELQEKKRKETCGVNIEDRFN